MVARHLGAWSPASGGPAIQVARASRARRPEVGATHGNGSVRQLHRHRSGFMTSLGRRDLLLVTILMGLTTAAGTSSCSRLSESNEQAQVVQTFTEWKQAMIDQRTGHALVFIPSRVNDYLNVLNSGTGKPIGAPGPALSASPGVDLLLRTALEKKVPANMRPHLTLASLLQRIADRHLFNPRDVKQIDLGAVSIEGNRASAEVYYQGTLTALRLPFIKEGEVWKIDVMALLPYAEVLMRVDRAIKGETEAQQVDQLVSKLPAL
jgi:hypothetical protein